MRVLVLGGLEALLFGGGGRGGVTVEELLVIVVVVVVVVAVDCDAVAISASVLTPYCLQICLYHSGFPWKL